MLWRRPAEAIPGARSAFQFLEHGVQTHHFDKILHAQKRFVQTTNGKARSGRHIPDVIGMMLIAARIRQTERVYGSSFHGKGEHSAGVQTFCHSGDDPFEIAEVDEAIQRNDQIETFARAFEPRGDFRHFKPVIDTARMCELDHLGRKVDPRQAR